MAAAAAAATATSRVEAMVRMVHSGVLPPYLAALKQQLLDECDRQEAAAGDGTHPVELQVYTDGSASLSLRKSTSPSVTRKLVQEQQQQAPWDQDWHGVRDWDWDDVRGTPGGAQDRETSLCLLLALLPSLHPRLTALHIYKSTEAPVTALCAALLSLSRQPPPAGAATTITHLTLECTRLRRQGDVDAHGSTETGSARHLSRFLRSAHCTLLSLHLQHFHDDAAATQLEDLEQGGHGGGGRVTALGHIARALQVNTSVTALRLAWCTLSSSTVREVAAMFSHNRTVQVLALRGVECEAEERGPGHQSSSRCQWSRHILPALRGCSALRSVTLHDCRGIRGDEVVRSLRELARANATIQHLGLEGTPLDEDGKAATILKELHLGEEVHDQDNTMAAAAACSASVEEDRYPEERADTSCTLGEASTSAGHHEEFQDNTTAAAAAAWSSSVAMEEMVDKMVRLCLACSSASVEETVRMAHSGGDNLAPSLVAFKQELLDECERQAARGDDHDLSLKLTWRDLQLARSSMSVSLAEEYQQAPWDRTWDDVRQWNWCDVLDVGAGAEKVSSLCLLLALLPSLHPRLTTLHICILSEIQVMEGLGEWMQDLGDWRCAVLPYLVRAVEVLCASMLTLSSRSANTIAHLELTVGFEDYTGRGSVHLSRLLCAAHCTLLSLQLDGATDGHRNVVDVDRDKLGPGGEEMTSLCRIVDALRANTSLTALRISNCMLCSATVREMDLMFRFRNSTSLQALSFCHNTFDTEEDVKDVARWLGKTVFSAPSLHTLQCWHAPFSATHWSGTILPAMCGNRALRNISLRENSGIQGDEVFQCLLHLVLTNTRIHHLGLERTPLDEDGRAATILKELQEVHAYW